MMQRTEGLATEVAFWRAQMDQIVGNAEPNLGWRLLPREIESRYMALVSPERRPSARILDVGSGPFTHHGSLWLSKAANLICVDPLADVYKTLCSERKIYPPVPPVLADGERLTDVFARNSFDLVVSTNAIDHAEHPLAVIEQMFDLCRPGGSVFIEVVENVGELEKYYGLHQHNFTIEGDRLILWRPDGFRIDVNEAFGRLIGRATSDSNHPWRQFEWGAGTISMHFVKRS